MSLNCLCLRSMTHASNHPDYMLHLWNLSRLSSIPTKLPVLSPILYYTHGCICTAYCCYSAAIFPAQFFYVLFLEQLRQLSVHHLSPTPADRRPLDHAVIRIHHTHLVCLTPFGSNTLAIVIKRRINARPAVFVPHLRFVFILPGSKRRRISITKTVPTTSAQLGPFRVSFMGCI